MSDKPRPNPMPSKPPPDFGIPETRSGGSSNQDERRDVA
jgi:hypothetical protein